MSKTINKNPLVTVIIPTYNRGWILKEAIDSVLSQDFEDFELIVVDDGSTDNTREIVGAYDVMLLHEPKPGPSAARNRGLYHASGEIVAYLDADAHRQIGTRRPLPVLVVKPQPTRVVPVDGGLRVVAVVVLGPSAVGRSPGWRAFGHAGRRRLRVVGGRGGVADAHADAGREASGEGQGGDCEQEQDRSAC